MAGARLHTFVKACWAGSNNSTYPHYFEFSVNFKPMEISKVYFVFLLNLSSIDCNICDTSCLEIILLCLSNKY